VLTVSLKKDKIEYLAVIKIFVEESLTPNEIRVCETNIKRFVLRELCFSRYQRAVHPHCANNDQVNWRSQ
jgi:hypothetical protein